MKQQVSINELFSIAVLCLITLVAIPIETHAMYKGSEKGKEREHLEGSSIQQSINTSSNSSEEKQLQTPIKDTKREEEQEENTFSGYIPLGQYLRKNFGNDILNLLLSKEDCKKLDKHLKKTIPSIITQREEQVSSTSNNGISTTSVDPEKNRLVLPSDTTVEEEPCNSINIQYPSTLEPLPEELLAHICQCTGDPLKYRTISRNVNQLLLNSSMNGSKWVVIKGSAMLTQYLSLTSLKEHGIPRVKVVYPITQEELEKLVAASPHITDLEITDQSYITDLGVIDPGITLILGKVIKTEAELFEIVEQSIHLPYSKITVKCSLSDECLKKLVELSPRLTSLTLQEGDNITDEGISCLPESLTELKINWFYNIKDLSQLKRLTDLTTLELTANTSLNHTDYQRRLGWLYNAKGREDLNLLLTHLPNLKNLSLRGCTCVTDETLTCLPPTLTGLNLYQCNHLKNLSALKKLTKLTELHVAGNYIESQVPECLKLLSEYCPNLRTLDLGSIKTQDSDLAFLPKTLVRLKLWRACIHSLSGLIDPKDGKPLCPNLVELDLSDCSNLNDLSILKELPHLTKVILKDCWKLKYRDLADWLPCTLTSLDLSKNFDYIEDIEDKEIGCIVRKCSNLIQLGLGGCRKMTGECFQYFPSTLIELDLSSRSIPYNNHLATLVEKCPNLATLKLGSDYKLEDLIPLHKLTNLTMLVLCRTKNEILSSIREKIPSLKRTKNKIYKKFGNIG